MPRHWQKDDTLKLKPGVKCPISSSQATYTYSGMVLSSCSTTWLHAGRCHNIKNHNFHICLRTENRCWSTDWILFVTWPVFRQICWPIHTTSRLWIHFIYSWSPGDMNLNVWESEKDNTWNWFRVFHQGNRFLFHLLIGIQANTSFYFLSHWCVSRHSSEQTALDLVTEDYKTQPKKRINVQNLFIISLVLFLWEPWAPDWPCWQKVPDKSRKLATFTASGCSDFSRVTCLTWQHWPIEED